MKYITNAPAGRDLLNVKRPGWAHLADPDALDMNSASKCVLGQVDGDYFRACGELFGRYYVEDSFRYGFCVLTWNGVYWRGMAETEVARLTAEWRDIITILRAES
jgi:hypothetical protein